MKLSSLELAYQGHRRFQKQNGLKYSDFGVQPTCSLPKKDMVWVQER